MPSPRSTLKPVVDLSADDLESQPIWEYVADEEKTSASDETWVRPARSQKIRKNVFSQLVAADFKTAPGRPLFGFMVVTTTKDDPRIAPGALIFTDKYLVLPTVSREIAVQENYSWSLRDRQEVLSALRAVHKQVFPMRYRLRVLISGESILREGIVE